MAEFREGWPTDGWGIVVADGLNQVLDHIVRRFLVRDEVRTIDLDASAAGPGDVLESEKREAATRETERSHDLREPFAAGLRLAAAGAAAGQPAIALDDRDPEQDRIAAALVHALVRTDLAASHAEETEENHYIYHLTVDWDALRGVAAEAGVDLDEALR